MKFIFVFLTCLIAPIYVLADSSFAKTPVGFWKTFNESDGTLRSIVQIQEKDGVLSGVIVKPIPLPGEPMTCVACKGALKDHTIQDFPLFSNVQADGDVWDGGQIVDPKTGNTYSVSLTLLDNGNKLKVRGFIGISLFGRTQVWIRELSEEVSRK